MFIIFFGFTGSEGNDGFLYDTDVGHLETIHVVGNACLLCLFLIGLIVLLINGLFPF